MDRITANDVAFRLAAAIAMAAEEDNDFDVKSVCDYREAGVLTNNDGFVLRLDTGEGFQITVVQTRK